MNRDTNELASSYVNILQNALGSLDMSVETERDIGPVAHVDVMASLGSRSYLFEIKAGGREQYLPVSAIEQARGTADFMARAGIDATPILYTDQTVSPASQMAADAMGVPIIQASQDQTIARNNIISTFQELAPEQGPTVTP